MNDSPVDCQNVKLPQATFVTRAAVDRRPLPAGCLYSKKSLLFGPSRTPVPTRFVYAIVGTDVLGGPFFHQTILKLEFSIYFFADMCYNQIDE